MFTVVGVFGSDKVTVNWIDGRVETPGNSISEYIKWLAKQPRVHVPVYAEMPDVPDRLADPLAAYLVIIEALDGGILKVTGDVPEISIAASVKGVLV